MNTTLLFFALLVPISGFIAWAGDKIGHVIGKRRHSLLGLRPRHTATLVTILSGVGIAAVPGGLDLPIYNSPLEYPNAFNLVRSRALAPFRRMGQQFLYRWYYLNDEVF